MNRPLARPRYHSIQSTRLGQPTHGSRPSPLLGKDILVFCDGTGKDGKLAKGDPTNIWRLYQLAISPEASNSTDRQKEIVYLSGIGSGASTNPLNLLSRIFGTTIVENIIAAYLHVAKHYQARDKVYLFGYSRGAFVARKVASLIYRIGIVRTKEELLKLWSQHERPVPWNLFNSEARGTRIPIESLVVWDTVGAIHSMPNQKKLEMDILGMPDDELTPNVQHAFHVVAFHENRKLFRVTLFNPRSTEDSRKLKEVWFPGAHSDVGGGGSGKLGLPNISLIWIIGELQSRCSLVIPHEKLEYPDLQTLTPSDAYRETAPWKRIVDKCETRLPLLKPSSLVHETVVYLRNLVAENLDPSFKPTPYMLSVNDLGRIGWDIKACLVARSALETLKLANAQAQKKLKEQAGHYRTRITSLYVPGTPRASTTITEHVHNTYQQSPRSRLPSTTTDKRSTTPTPPYQATHTEKGSRSRAESHAVPHSYLSPQHAAHRSNSIVAPQTERTRVTPTDKAPLSNPPSNIYPEPRARVASSARSRAASHVASPSRSLSPGNATQPVHWSQIAVPQQERATSSHARTAPPPLPYPVTPTSKLDAGSRAEFHSGSRANITPGRNEIPRSTSVVSPQGLPLPGARQPFLSTSLAPRRSPGHTRSTSTHLHPISPSAAHAYSLPPTQARPDRTPIKAVQSGKSSEYSAYTSQFPQSEVSSRELLKQRPSNGTKSRNPQNDHYNDVRKEESQRRPDKRRT